MAQQLKSLLLNVTSILMVQQQIFINKTMYDKWNYIRNHSLLYHLLFLVSRIPNCTCLSVSVTPFSLVLILGGFSYQLPISGSSISAVIVSVTPLALIWVRGLILPDPPPSPCWFSRNNSETVKSVTLPFCNIQ